MKPPGAKQTDAQNMQLVFHAGRNAASPPPYPSSPAGSCGDLPPLDRHSR
jgi:hypothetical protein